jgi:predicted MFS family arabinose efflux permease
MGQTGRDEGWEAWRVVAALGVTQVVSWGTLYYAFAVVMVGVQEDLVLSAPVVVGAYSLALLVSGFAAAPVGRLIDRRGARLPMTVGTVLAGVLLAAFSQVSGAATLYLVWAGLGLAMGLVLYEPAFASLALVFKAGLRRAITVLTLAGGFASTVFWPLTQWLEANLGWRDAVLVLAALNLLLCLPLHALFLPAKGRSSPAGAASSPDGRKRLLKDARFRWLAAAFTLHMLAQSALSVHLLAMLQSHGFTPARAAWLAALIGPMQVAARVLEFAVAARVSAARVGAWAMLSAPVGIGFLMVAGDGVAWALLFVVLYGAGNGVMTIVRGTVPAEIWGRDGYGGLSGLMATPVLLMRAAGPLIAAGVLAVTGGYMAVQWLLLVASLLATLGFVHATRH